MDCSCKPFFNDELNSAEVMEDKALSQIYKINIYTDAISHMGRGVY